MMLETMGTLFTNLIGTLAVLVVIAFFVAGSEALSNFTFKSHYWKFDVLAGCMGGLFGVYGNLAGININGAIISIRDVGPMMAGYIGGPIGGLIAGVIAGAHRLTMGGITATACIIATCTIGIVCGLLFRKYRLYLSRPIFSLLTGAAMEVMHLCIVLLIVKPFDVAWDIVSQIALPFVTINAAGITALIFAVSNIEKRRLQEAEHNRLKSELQAASVIQQSLLPPISDRYPGREEIRLAASMEAAKEVGGDFYDFFFVDRDHFAILIADVAGKGIPAALFMANAKTTLQNCVRDFETLEEAIVMANDSLCDHNDAEIFVTSWIGVLEIPTGRIKYVCAGHNPPVILSRTGGDSSATFLGTRPCFVLGGMEGVKYRSHTIDLKPSDKLFLYTDGVTEAENKDKELYGNDRLLKCLESAADQDVDQILERVRESVRQHVKDADQFDDITMVCMEFQG